MNSAIWDDNTPHNASPPSTARVPLQSAPNQHFEYIEVGELAGIAPGPAGTYTPILTAVTNVASSGSGVFKWFLVGSVAYASGAIAVDPTAGSTLTSIGISLPPEAPSNLALADQLTGIAIMDNGVVMTPGRIQGDATNDRAQLDFYADSGAVNRAWIIQFSYVVL